MTKSIVNKAMVTMGLVLLLATGSAQGWNGLTNVAEVQARPDMTAVRFTEFTWTDCGAGQFKVGGANPTANERAMYATLLAAALAGKQVWVVTGGCDASMEILQFVGLYP
jgi:hypothetical protein